MHNYSQKLLDYSSNINPLGVPDSFKDALLSNIEEFTKYPDINYIKLRKAIGRYLAVEDISFIVPGNGAIELLYKAIQQSGKSRLISLKPTFSEYSRAALQCGIEYRALDAFDSEYQDVNIEIILESASNDSVVIICNPNNPTGTLINKKKLLQLAEGLKKKGAMLIIDEAFMEFTPDYPKNSMLDQLDKFDNVLIVKAATKFFGMPGIRLGYAISNNLKLINKIRESIEPWNVNTSAVIAGCSMLEDSHYILNSRVWITTERDNMFNELDNIKGIRVYPSAANFHLIKLLKENFDAWQLKEKLLEKNILIRTPEGFEGLDGSYVRLAVKQRESNRILIEELNNILNNKV
ncbi:MAG: putative L-threonine-O-3-phosphate decarboxylase [Clostridia bacterium]|nr:putative L-threonine-O-3-phosphate decarboxylase [Clostridia bacterium]